MQSNLISYDNKFRNFFGCFMNIPTLLIGWFFPCCLFGQIFQKAEFGDFYTGCCKYFCLQCSISTLFNIFFILMYVLTMPLTHFSEDSCHENITRCKNISITSNCDITINHSITNGSMTNGNMTNGNMTNGNMTNGNMTNNEILCKCIINNMVRKCEWENTLSEDTYLMISFSYLIYSLYIVTFYSLTGMFLGIYRTRIAYKYNISTDRRLNCLLHMIPICNQLALCQESNTIDYYECHPIITVPTTSTVQVSTTKW